MIIKKVTPQEWNTISEMSHLVVFNEARPKSMDRIDYALLVEEGPTLMAYATLREIDEETVYIQYGGSYPSAKGTINSFKAYLKVIGFLCERYKRATTLVENNNQAMLKFAMKAGGLITGIRYFEGSVLCEITFKF